MTEKRRAATAAAAIVHRMMMRRSPLLDFPVLPRSKGSMAEEVVAMMAKEEEGNAPVLVEEATKTSSVAHSFQELLGRVGGGLKR
jgi:hypothetical protein